MAASVRRRRFERAAAPAFAAVTPQTLRLLRWLSLLGQLTSRQVMALSGLSPKSARRLLRSAFDQGLLDIVPLPRGALLNTPAPVLGGSAPNLYALSRLGQKALQRSGDDPPALACDWRERSAAFLTHAILTREVAVYFTRCALQGQGEGVLEWCEGGAAELPLSRTSPPRVVRPDARIVVGFGENVLSCLVELDRGTERLNARQSRWKDKVTAYGLLFGSGKLKELTGYGNARVLVVATTDARVEAIAAFLVAQAPPALSSRFWLTTHKSLEKADVTAPLWWQPGKDGVAPLLRAEQLSQAGSTLP